MSIAGLVYEFECLIDIFVSLFPVTPCSSGPCFYDGTCLYHVNSSEHECTCLQGFSGENCQGESIPMYNELNKNSHYILILFLS